MDTIKTLPKAELLSWYGALMYLRHMYLASPEYEPAYCPLCIMDIQLRKMHSPGIAFHSSKKQCEYCIWRIMTGDTCGEVMQYITKEERIKQIDDWCIDIVGELDVRCGCVYPDNDSL